METKMYNDRETKIWVEFISPYDAKPEGMNLEEAVSRLTDDYNAFFKRVGLTFDPLFWSDRNGCWCFQDSRGGTFLECRTPNAGVWLNANGLAMPESEDEKKSKSYAVMVPPYEKDLIVGTVRYSFILNGWLFHPRVDGRKPTKVGRLMAHLAVPKWVGEFKLA